MLLLVLFVYFLYRVLFVVGLFIIILYYSFYLFFNYFLLRQKFNIIYLFIPNFVAVALYQSFNVMIHFINYLCLNWLILVFRLVFSFLLRKFYFIIYVLRVRAYIRKSFLKNNSKIIFLFIY